MVLSFSHFHVSTVFLYDNFHISIRVVSVSMIVFPIFLGCLITGIILVTEMCERSNDTLQYFKKVCVPDCLHNIFI